MARATRSYRGTRGFRGWNPSAVVAGFASAAVAGRLLGLDADGIARAMGLSYAQASGNQQCIEDGGIVKRMQPGSSPRPACARPCLARAGVTGAVDAIEGRNGYFAVYEDGEYDPASLTDGLGEDARDRPHRLQALPRLRHGATGGRRACANCRPSIGFGLPTTSSRHHGHGSKFVVDMVGRPYRPGRNPEVDAQFSLTYCLATVLETGKMRAADSGLRAHARAGRRALADRIPVRLDGACTASGPRASRSRCMTDGR